MKTKAFPEHFLMVGWLITLCHLAVVVTAILIAILIKDGINIVGTGAKVIITGSNLFLPTMIYFNAKAGQKINSVFIAFVSLSLISIYFNWFF